MVTNIHIELEREGKIERKAVSGIALTLLSIDMITWTRAEIKD